MHLAPDKHQLKLVETSEDLFVCEVKCHLVYTVGESARQPLATLRSQKSRYMYSVDEARKASHGLTVAQVMCVFFEDEAATGRSSKLLELTVA